MYIDMIFGWGKGRGKGKGEEGRGGEGRKRGGEGRGDVRKGEVSGWEGDRVWEDVRNFQYDTYMNVTLM